MELDKNLLRRAFDKEPVLILLGQSGCGKGTQLGQLAIAKDLVLPEKSLYVAESGQIWRDTIPKMTSFNQSLANEIQTAGKLQSWITTSALWGAKFLSEYNGGPIIVDGSPRSVDEAKALVEFYNGFAKKDIIVFFLQIPDEEAEIRMVARNTALVTNGVAPRCDTDTPEKRKTKIAYFHSDVMPALQYLRAVPGVRVHNIQGMNSPLSVTHTILSTFSHFHS